MIMAQEYRRFAVRLTDLAEPQAEPTETTGRLIVAEAWLDLSERTAQSSSDVGEAHKAVERPLIAAHVIRYRHDD